LVALIHNLVASTVDNDVEYFVGAVHGMAVRYGWSEDEKMAVAQLVCEVRERALSGAQELVATVLRDLDSKERKR
jgi:hypothetical protein